MTKNSMRTRLQCSSCGRDAFRRASLRRDVASDRCGRDGCPGRLLPAGTLDLVPLQLNRRCQGCGRIARLLRGQCNRCLRDDGDAATLARDAANRAYKESHPNRIQRMARRSRARARALRAFPAWAHRVLDAREVVA